MHYVDTSALVKLVVTERETPALPSTATYDNAALLEPQILRTLDALHLASALELGDDLSGLITYDTRMAGAAAALGLAVVAPG